jgi:hypothetical protein
MNWCQTLRTEWWHRFAVCRLLADAAEGKIVAYHGPHAHAVPASYFDSDVDLDATVGDLFLSL